MSKTFKPTQAMSDAAKKAIKMRDKQPPSNKGMTSVGLARARQLIDREGLSLDTVKRMYSFFSRHEVDKKSKSWKKGESKGEQAWLGWGGDPGYTWSKSIVEREAKANNADVLEFVNESNPKSESNMKQNVLIYTNVGKSQITDTDSHFKITGIPVTKNDSVMNNVLYPADENQRGMPTMKEKPITLRHPVVDGVNVSATQGKGLNYFSGSLVESEPYIENNTWKIDALINKKKLAAQDDGDRWTEILSNKELFGVSTGLTFERNSESGEINGKPYDMVAKGQKYDHLAFLDPKVEKPAGGDNTMVRFNSSVEAGEIIVHNIEHDDGPQINQEHKGLFNKFLSWLGSHGEFADGQQLGYNNTDYKTNRSNTMLTRDETIELLANAGIKIATNASDEDVKTALNEYMSKSKKKDEEDEENMGDKDKKKMSKSNSEEAPKWAQDLLTKVNSLETAVNANAEAELNQVAEQVAALNMGLDADAAKKLGLDGAKSFLAANSSVSAAGFPGAQRSSAANSQLLDSDMPE